MKIFAWVGLGVVVAVLIGGSAAAIPGLVLGHENAAPSSSGAVFSTTEPAWNTGNLCQQLTTVGTVVTCDSYQSASPVNLYWNFSSGEVQGMTFNVVVYGSVDCIIMNFHSFYSTINIDLKGSNYACGGLPDPQPGVWAAINSEGDTVNIDEQGSSYSSVFYAYGGQAHSGAASIGINIVLYGSFLSPNVDFIGLTPGFAVCPSGIVYKTGVTEASEISYGSYNLLNTTWVDGTNNPHAAGLNMAYTTSAFPVSGDIGNYNLIGTEVTQTPPVDSCAYLDT